MPELTIPFRIELIKRAIERIEAMQQTFRDVSADATKTSVECDWARAGVEGSIREFRYQWENVKAVLAHYEQEKTNAKSV